MPAPASAFSTETRAWSSTCVCSSTKCGRDASTLDTASAATTSSAPPIATMRVRGDESFRAAANCLKSMCASYGGGSDVHPHRFAVGVDQLVADLERELERELGGLDLRGDLVEVGDLARDQRLGQLVDALHPGVRVAQAVAQGLREAARRGVGGGLRASGARELGLDALRRGFVRLQGRFDRRLRRARASASDSLDHRGWISA